MLFAFRPKSSLRVRLVIIAEGFKNSLFASYDVSFLRTRNTRWRTRNFEIDRIINMSQTSRYNLGGVRCQRIVCHSCRKQRASHDRLLASFNYRIKDSRWSTDGRAQFTFYRFKPLSGRQLRLIENHRRSKTPGSLTISRTSHPVPSRTILTYVYGSSSAETEDQ